MRKSLRVVKAFLKPRFEIFRWNPISRFILRRIGRLPVRFAGLSWQSLLCRVGNDGMDCRREKGSTLFKGKDK